jgi:hypothetical protein
MPARVEPVKETMSISEWTESADPVIGPSPLSILKTPFGVPAASITSAKSNADRGENSLGFKITVQPAAIAGASFVMICSMGQFQGVISAATPIGSRRIVVGPRRSSSG